MGKRNEKLSPGLCLTLKYVSIFTIDHNYPSSMKIQTRIYFQGDIIVNEYITVLGTVSDTKSRYFESLSHKI